jgi:thioredoxin-dependent peroxiredoxin
MSKLLFVSAMCVALASTASAQTPAVAGAPMQAPAQAPTMAAPAVELKVGDKAPEFSLPGTDGKTHKLSDYKGKYVVVGWYPAAFTGGCTAECRSFRDSGDVIKAYDVAYFMASTDTAEKNADFAKQEMANFPMLSDPTKATATAYGVLGGRGTANRWTFYIAPNGTIAYIDKNVNADGPANAGPKLAERLAALNVPKKK